MANTITLTTAPLIYATCGCLPITSTTMKNKFVSVALATLAENEIQWTTHSWFPGATLAAVPIITTHASSDDNVTMTTVVGHPSEIPSSPIEVTEATDLSGLKVRFELYSRTRE